MRGRGNHILLSVFHNSTIRYEPPMTMRGTHAVFFTIQQFGTWHP
jgi:hypothetical protein